LYSETGGARLRYDFPMPVVRVRAPAATASATPTATLSTTPTTTPAATLTSTPTPTALPSHLYLPVGLREHCDRVHRRADVALVVDTSSSMNGQKLEGAKRAAAAFVGQMDLAPGNDQVAVVRYDAEAEVVCQLTNARAVIEATIRNLTTRSGTHIDKGLRLALGELQGPRRIERNLPVMVLLTDGIQTGTPGAELRAADEVRDAGVRLYTIGLGEDVNAAALQEMAGDRSRYHFAPAPADLARIYAEIASDILCAPPADGFWPSCRTSPP
jgi:Ca-activated chloride channel family protein